MTRYWVIAPYDSTRPQVFDAAWAYDLANGTIAIGWSELGDVSGLTKKPELVEVFKKVYGDKQQNARDSNCMWNFYHEINQGDIVIARRGTKRIVGIGTVKEPPFFDEKKGGQRVGNLGEDDYYPNFIKVTWEPKDIAFERIIFSFFTMYEIPEEKYYSLLNEALGEPTAFKREEFLRDYMADNFKRVFGDRLKLYHNEDGMPGVEFPIVDDAGKQMGAIDILATEPASQSYMVIELKREKTSDQVVGQVLRYMGWVQENLCSGGQQVKGMIVCAGQDKRLRLALKPVSDIIAVKLYELSIHLKLSDPPQT